jgi:hypothetical protein
MMRSGKLKKLWPWSLTKKKSNVERIASGLSKIHLFRSFCQTLERSFFLKSDLRSDQDLRLKKDLGSDQDHGPKQILFPTWLSMSTKNVLGGHKNPKNSKKSICQKS